MKEDIEKILIKATKAEEVEKKETLQELWSGYGKIIRYKTSNEKIPYVIVKHIQYPDQRNHPTGWNTDRSHKRKLKSYKVETEWYRNWALKCGENCRIPFCLGIESNKNEVVIILEDLDYAGFSGRRRYLSIDEMQSCLDWLANFHAVFFNRAPQGLWKNGTYWHLDTRPDELNALTDNKLKSAAGKIDLRLKNCKFKTIVHGDAKLANFCFSPARKKVAAVDFQYVGGGCGMKDIAYFIGSCFNDDECEKYEKEVLNYYFDSLKNALKTNAIDINFSALESEWRDLYYFACADFYRFLKGWSPVHGKSNTYAGQIARELIGSL